MQYFINNEYKVFGPFEEDHIREMLALGHITESDLCSTDQKTWVEISEVPELLLPANVIRTPLYETEDPPESEEETVFTSDEKINSDAPRITDTGSYEPVRNKVIMIQKMLFTGHLVFMILVLLAIVVISCIHWSPGATARRQIVREARRISSDTNDVNKSLPKVLESIPPIGAAYKLLAALCDCVRVGVSHTDETGAVEYSYGELYFWGYSGEINDEKALGYYEAAKRKGNSDAKIRASYYPFFYLYRLIVFNKSFCIMLVILFAAELMMLRQILLSYIKAEEA